MTNAQVWNEEKWIERKLEEQRCLYDLYGRALKNEHTGEFVAISLDGDIILDRRLGEVLKRAMDTFGRDNFAVARRWTMRLWRNGFTQSDERRLSIPADPYHDQRVGIGSPRSSGYWILGRPRGT